LTVQAILTLGVIFGVLAGFLFTRLRPEALLLGGLAVLLLAGVLTPSQGLAGFSNEGMLTVAILFVVAAGIRETGGIGMIVRLLLGRPKSMLTAQARVMLPVAASSAFLNNTPIVAMLLPAILDWAKNMRMAPSKFLIPLSYAAILGGMCTLIGTSTNLIVNGLILDARPEGLERGLGFFDITWVGVPCALIGIAFMLGTSRWLLPDRRPPIDPTSDPREYTLEMEVEEGGPLCGQTIEEAGLRHLQGVFVAEIERDGDVIPAVAPTERLKGNDRLVFVGIVDSVVDLQRIRGLRPAANQVFKLDSPRSQRALIEAVVSNTSPMLGRTIREGRFRNRYDAVIIAVSRNGERLRKKIGDIILEPGDTLLIEAPPEFVERQRNSRDFFLVSRVEGYTPPRHDRAFLAMGILAAMVIAASVFQIPMLHAAIAAAALMLLTRCVTTEAARRSVDMSVVLSIAAAIGLGNALRVSGASESIAAFMVGLAGDNVFLTLVAIYITTSVFTEIVTNNAAAVLMFPIALATANSLDVSLTPYAIAIMIGASASFATPIGYQTNLMVYGPGGYRFSDFLKAGTALNIIVMVVALTLIPIFFPLR
jgi:di/tricarboxylate transporter